MTPTVRWAALRQTFLSRSIEELAALCEKEMAALWQQDVAVVHKIAGTGFSLGFSELAEEARTLERQWRALPAVSYPREARQVQLNRLIEHCRRLEKQTTSPI